MHKSNKGFTTVEIIIVAFVVIVIGLAGFYVSRNHSKIPAKKVSVTAAKEQTSKASGNKTSGSMAATAAASPVTSKSTSTSTPATTKASASSSSSGSAAAVQKVSSSPTISISSPTNGQVLTSSQFAYSCSFTTSTGTGTVSEQVKNSDGQVVDGFTINNTTSDNCYEQSENTNNVYPNGNYTITFTVTDSEGKTATATNQFTWDL